MSAREQESRCDLAAVGCGPFNLSLAALASRIPALQLSVYEARPELRWHPGLMFDDATLQLSFLADLVTLVDPTHPLSFLAYLQAVDRMWPFFIREQFHPTRREYEDYLRWASERLPSLHFSHHVERIEWDEARKRFVLEIARDGRAPARVLAKDLVLGIGTEPRMPPALAALPAHARLHSSDYLSRTQDIARAAHVTVVGSGQSAAEIVVDLLRRNLAGGPAITWLTRTPTFAPLDYSKLTLEMTTPTYVRYFHGLPQAVKDRLNTAQWQHYKGISEATLVQIHELLYQRELSQGLAKVELRSGVIVETAELRDAATVLGCRHRDSEAQFDHVTSLVVAATGYVERKPSFLAPLERAIKRDPQERYRVRLDHSIELDAAIRGRIFVANAELHSHGVATPDLGMSAYRNATILNTLLGREVYPLPRRTAFSSFGLPTESQTLGAALSHAGMGGASSQPSAAALALVLARVNHYVAG